MVPIAGSARPAATNRDAKEVVVPKLVVFRGDAVEKEVRLARSKTLRIGRHERNDVVLDDSANGVSRFHAELRPEGASYFIVDMQSRNGIWLNGRRIKEKAALTPGVSVTIGGFELTLEDDTSSSVFDSQSAVPAEATVAERPHARKEEPSRPAVRPSPRVASRPANRRQIVLWSTVCVVLLLVIAGTFAVVRYVTAPVTVAEAPPPVVPVEPAPPPPPPTPEPDPNKVIVEGHLAEARARLDAKDFAGALNDHIAPALEL